VESQLLHSGYPLPSLTNRECRIIIKAAGQAAADGKAALIDGVYLHGHEGYLLEQMTNPAFNHRKLADLPTGRILALTWSKRFAARRSQLPIMYRIDLSLALNETYGKRMEDVASLKNSKKNARSQTLAYMVNLVKSGVDMFDVDLGCYDNWWLPTHPNSMPSGCFLRGASGQGYFAHEKVFSNAGLPVPIVAVGKLGYPDLAETGPARWRSGHDHAGAPLLADADCRIKLLPAK